VSQKRRVPPLVQECPQVDSDLLRRGGETLLCKKAAEQFKRRFEMVRASVFDL
jgi:hypothetical protein